MKKEIEKQLHDYTFDVTQRIITTNFDTLASIVDRLITVKANRKTVYTAGNGGSAATASHFCNDLVKGCRVNDKEGIKGLCLSDSNALVTCLANDYSYDDIFSIPLQTFASEGDVLVVFSGSGNSPNIIKVLKTAQEMGVFTIGFSGRDGGKMKGLCNLFLLAPTDSMEQIEDMHLLYTHAIINTIKQFL
jgi:D-sedoheptulose 7-phosphate isomerase